MSRRLFLLPLALTLACHPPAADDPDDTDTDGLVDDTDDTDDGGDTDVPLDPLSAAIGQMLVVGFRGKVLDDSMPIVAQIEAGQVGGVVLFDRDVLTGTSNRNIASPDQLRTLVADLKRHTGAKLIVSIDQEGGFVNRLKTTYGFPATESAQDLGERDDLLHTRAAGAAIGATLADMGINLNLAPVVDVNVNPDSPAIGAIERSFSSDPDKVVAHAEAMISGFDDHAIRSCLKHFPGHGSATSDSHAGFTDVSTTWTDIELDPYRDIFADGMADAVMTAHVFHEDLDPDWPATLSPLIVQGLLRDELGYDGVVITDDMQMGAIQDVYGLKDAVEAAILAGNDLLVFANNNPDVYDDEIAPKVIALVKAAVEEGRIPRARIDEAVARIEAFKAGLTR